MQGFRKKVKSVLVTLMAMLSVLPPQTACAVDDSISAVKGVNDSVVHWGTTLPSATTDTSYSKDTNWYRLILRSEAYTTNAIDSSGNYSSPSSGKSTSWPSGAWHNSKEAKVKNTTWNNPLGLSQASVVSQPEDWIGKNTYDQFDTLSFVTADYYLYSDGEHTMTGVKSLYIKYAGTAKDGKTPCYYISPCDENGNRAKKLWALDCCLDAAADDNEGQDFTERFYEGSDSGVWPGMKAMVAGIEPTFTLLTPTFDEFETSDTFKHAGLAVPYYQDAFHATWDFEENEGHLWGDYKDNHKWIFTQNTDGSWNIKSAGYIDWDWNAEDGDLDVLFGDSRVDVFQMGIGAYIKACCYAQLPGQKSRDDDGKEYAIIERYYLSQWITTITRDLMDRPGIPLVPMLWLNDYAQNVYITAGYYLGGTDDGFKNGITKKQLSQNKISTACGAYWKNDWDVDEYDAWVDWDVKNANRELIDSKYHYYTWTHNALAKEQIILVGSDGKAKSVEDIKKIVKLGPYKFWSPSSYGDGAWREMFIGTPLTTETYNSDNTAATISAGVTKVLGSTDKNGDGVCDGAAYIGSLDKPGGTVTIEAGATLEIDGPTYVASGTCLNVYGSLVISPGAYLCVEDSNDDQNLWIDIYSTGKVVISSGAMLDLGMGQGSISIHDGSLINNGVCIIGSYDAMGGSYQCVRMYGGEIQNGPTGWFITGASVKSHKRMAFLNEATRIGTSFEYLAWYFDHLYDYSFGEHFTNNLSAFSVADIQMSKEGESNTFTNEGVAYIGGAMKAEEGSESTFMGKGKLYRFWDLYGTEYMNKSFICDMYHRQRRNASEKAPKEDEFDIAFYALDNIYTGEIHGDSEAETQCLKDNVLALRVGTGSEGTDKISAFKIKYVGTDSKTYTMTVSPAAEEASFNFVKEYNYCGLTQNVAGGSELKTHAWGEVFSEAGFSRALEPYTNTTYFFQTQYPVKYVESISIIGAGTGSWSCTELNLYRVKYLFPLKEYGWSSWKWYAPFTGTLLAQVPLTEDKTLGVNGNIYLWGSEDIEFGTGTYPLNVYEVPSTVSSKSDSTGFCYYNASTEKVEYSTKEETYLFSTSLADAENAGIESRYIVKSDTSFSGYYTTNQLMSYETESHIMLLVRYIDTNGSIRTASMNSTLNALEWANYCLDATEKQQILHGLFQQGEDIVFEGILPDFKKAYSVSMAYNDSAANSSIAVTSFVLIKPDDIQTNRSNLTIADGILKADTSGTPVGFYNAGDLKGTYVSAGQTMTVYTKEWNGTENVKPSQKGSRYLVVVKTDEMSDAATMRDISVEFAYKTLSDMPATTQTYDLRSMVNDYYGYWLSADGKDADCAYKSAVSKNGELRFVIDAENLYKFTSATFSMKADSTIATNLTEYDSTGKDEWQMSSINIYEVTELGARKVQLGNGVTASGIITNRTYYRDSSFGVRGVINSGKGPLMVSPGQSKTINFSETTGGGSTITGGGEAVSKNKLTDVQELSYYETKQDFGLNAKRTAYNITVHVDGKSITSVEDGDCGSKNQFYFQLVFQDKNGKQRTSPMVLSNQQLKSDGFRTGTEEEFSIYANDDYGTPTQINIIPDDTSSTSDVFDKLCIDYITVSKTSSTGVSLNWATGNVGWIDIEYKDDQGDQTGRSDAELIRSFELKDAGYNVWIEFGIDTAAEYLGEGQFVGQVTADITYRNSSGAVKVKTVPVVGRIADYCERKSELATATEDGTEVSVPMYMFRKGYTNRFLVQFDDIKSLINMKLTVTPEADTSWAVDRVFARQVFDQGTLSLNKLNEYEHHYNDTPNDLTTSTNGSTVRIEPKGGSATATFVFSSGNSIIVNADENGESLEVTKGKTEGVNDYITMTAEIEDITGIDFNSSISANVIYKNIYGNLCSVKTSLIYDNTSKRFVISKNSLPTTSNIGMAYRLELTSSSLAGRVFKSATLCQMRGDTVLHEVIFEPGADSKLDAEVPLTISIPESQVDSYAEEKGYVTNTQNVFLQTGTLSESTLLSKSSDVQVALVYTKKGDEYYEHSYESDYISVLESGYSVLYSDMILVIPFHVSDVGGITGIKLKTNNSAVKLKIAQGCIAVEEVSNLTNKILFSGWVNLPTASENVTTAGITMSSDGRSLTEALTSANRLTPSNLDINVSKINRTDAVLGATLYYSDTAGAIKSVGGVMSANDWNYTGGWTLLKDFKTPVYFTMEALDYDPANTAGATVTSAIISWYDAGGVKRSAGLDDAVALIEGKTVSSSLVTTALTGTVRSGDGKQSATLESNLIKDGRSDYNTLKFIGKGTVNISASLPGLPGELEISCVNTETGEQLFPPVASYATGETVAYSYTLSANTGTETLHYCVTVASKNMPHQYAAKVYFDVEPAVYIEGYAYLNDGTLLGSFTATDAVSHLFTKGFKINQGDVITVYARVMNNSNTALSYTMEPADGTAFTVTAEENATVFGNAGTYTAYKITAGANMPMVNSRFRVYSVADPTVSYSLIFEMSGTP